MAISIASAIVMVEPTTFGYNEETAVNNFFQNKTSKIVEQDILYKVKNEFYAFVNSLREEGINVFVKIHAEHLRLPDAVFPNNWISFLPGGIVVIYPMMAKNRREEKELEMINEVVKATAYNLTKIIDLTYFESENKFLEGTGSIVFDHQNKLAYASLSPRTSKEVLVALCRLIGYSEIIFDALDSQGRPIYHTNVLFTLTSKCAIVCLDAISKKEDQLKIRNKLKQSEHEIVELNFDQMSSFAGNMLEVQDIKGNSLLIMSASAHDSLNPNQLANIKKYHKPVIMEIPVIEATGGGSARCMMAEVFTAG